MLASSFAVGRPVEFGIPGLFGLIVLEVLGGLAIGGGLGWLGAQILRRVALPSSGLYPLAVLVWTIFVYGIAAFIHASGFAAVYVCALILGNVQLPHRAATRSFVEGIGWIAQIGLFVMLGLLAFLDRVTPRAAPIAVTAGLVLTLIARPASVVACAVSFKIPLRHQVFLSWAGLRGAVPIVLATIPLAQEVPGQRLFSCRAGLRHRLHLPAGSDAALRRPSARAGR